ncbi:retrovirus-related pol polyprotein from transposon TNT 1-94 [Tanacetum coccineum]
MVPLAPQDIWSKEKHIELVNIIGEPLDEITTRSRVRDSEAASAHECLYVNFLSQIEPKRLIEALEEEGWIIAMQEELNQFERNKEGIDYDETFAPVARIEAIRIFLAYGAYMGFMVYQMDVKSAFLNGKISEEVYVQQAPGFESNEFPNHVCKLDKALYGLKQAPRAWDETLSKFLIQHKFVRGTTDNTLFTYKTKSDVIIVQIYVDDISFGSTSDKMSKQFAKLMTKKYEMSMMDELTYFLGFQIKQDFKGITICQEKYVKDLLKKFKLADSTSVKCPMLPTNNLGPDKSGVSVNETLFRGMIGSLMPLVSQRIRLGSQSLLRLRLRWRQKLGGKLRCWSSKKQSSMAMSSAKAEYVAGYWMLCSSSLDQKYHFIKDHILKGDIELHFVPTDLQLADIFTKPLAELSFTRLVTELDANFAFNNSIALLESKIPLYKDMLLFLSNSCISKTLTIQPSAIYTKYLREFWYTTEVVEDTITFSLLNVEKSLLFNQDIFLSIVGLDYTKDFVSLPSHKAMKDALATLGLADDKRPTMTFVALANSSPLRLRYFSLT